MLRIAVLVGALSLLVPFSSRAAFHTALIDEVMSGVGANANLQYVEIRMLLSGQNSVCHTRLTVFKCVADGGGNVVLIDNLGGVSAVQPCVADGMAGHRWIMASPNASTFMTASGITPDFTWNDGVAGNIPTSCGMVCWGAPQMGPLFIPPADPSTWDASMPGNYVDCVAYGSYDGTAEPFGNPAASTTPGGGTFSLTRMGDTFFSNNFQLACPTPTASGGTQTPGSFGACSPPTTTTTTTTLPPGPNKCSSKELAAAGKKAAAKVKCLSQAISKGVTTNLASCNSAAETKFGTAYGKAVAIGMCRSATGATAAEMTVDNFVSSLNTQLTGGATTASKCTSKELAAAGKLAGAEVKCVSKAVGKGDASTITGCESTAKTKFEPAYDKAVALGSCLSTADKSMVETTVQTFVDNLQGQLAP